MLKLENQNAKESIYIAPDFLYCFTVLSSAPTQLEIYRLSLENINKTLLKTLFWISRTEFLKLKVCT